MRTFEIFTEEYSKIVQEYDITTAIQIFLHQNPDVKIIAVIDVEYSGKFK